ncbi:hypothetical protein [Aestuariibaculum sediminum]|uniref:Lipocalin-like domain-containing protein n=1 Tax=Aestuariibaculum sediminum TaxID=2770637 RepID=A0A8J6U8Q3_9FLAO|nr:hypothetical protein [Aestuariibaculum sediminum]MBD0833475.1 hypothetical protein [Aestuariibaculum sediminum]
MKYYFSILLMLINCFISCDKAEENNPCQPETTISTWKVNKEIKVDFNSEFNRNDYSIIEGNKLLFEYNHSGAQCDHFIDDEWGEKLIFHIEISQTKFEYNENDILLTNCFYQQYGAWVNHNKYEIKNGILKGEKISDSTWEITVNIYTIPLFEDEEPKNIQFKTIFTESN